MVRGKGAGGGEKITASFSLVKQQPSRTWFSDALLTATGRLCMLTGVCWRFDILEDVQRRTMKGQAVNDLISITLLNVMAMVLTA